MSPDEVKADLRALDSNVQKAAIELAHLQERVGRSAEVTDRRFAEFIAGQDHLHTCFHRIEEKLGDMNKTLSNEITTIKVKVAMYSAIGGAIGTAIILGIGTKVFG